MDPTVSMAQMNGLKTQEFCKSQLLGAIRTVEQVN